MAGAEYVRCRTSILFSSRLSSSRYDSHSSKSEESRDQHQMMVKHTTQNRAVTMSEFIHLQGNKHGFNDYEIKTYFHSFISFFTFFMREKIFQADLIVSPSHILLQLLSYFCIPGINPIS